MSEAESNVSSELIKGSVEVVKTIYTDALKPVATETGRALGTLGKSVNVALAPLRGLVWSWEQLEAWLTSTVEHKFLSRNVPPERIITPDPDLAVPAIEALRYTKLRDQYANLLATAMDARTANEAHPAYVEILKQLTPDEAKLIAFMPPLGRFVATMNLEQTLPGTTATVTTHRHITTCGIEACCQSLEDVPRSIDNLCRLGLAEIPALSHLAEDHRYDKIRELQAYQEAKQSVPEGSVFKPKRKMLGLTTLGASFRRACIG